MLNTLELPVVRPVVAAAIMEDLGRGDITTDACVPAESAGRATVVAREPLVFCGGALVAEVFAQIDPDVQVEPLCPDGTRLKAGDPAIRLTGAARSLLKGERLALNFSQRMSGIATLTDAYVQELAPGSRTRITDTRKTTPGLRYLERYAVRCGGGHSHRSDLGAAVLIKDNHIAAAGGITTAISGARNAAPHVSRITCEVDTLTQLHEALSAGADVVLLDNFSDADLATAMSIIDGRALVEVSGAVPLDRVRRVSGLNVDVISIGALTHSFRSVDLGLDWVPESDRRA